MAWITRALAFLRAYLPKWEAIKPWLISKLGPLLKSLVVKALTRPAPYPGRDNPKKPETEDSIKRGPDFNV